MENNNKIFSFISKKEVTEALQYIQDKFTESSRIGKQYDETQKKKLDK